ncbi:carbamoyl-phosphate-synthetase [Lysinibacillus sp. PLM2]|nr:carbamoyl-phosphate-synthetase [Lysinibacillus sp. PLM2]
MKKLLMLGGTQFQIPAIKKARELGHYVITCDEFENNPGHKYAHEYYSINIFDKDAVLTLAKELNIDGIIAYLSDSLAPIVAYVGEKLGLPSNPYKSVEIISNKEKFRNFLANNQFNVPKAKGYNSYEEVKREIDHFKLPVIIKPVDSSGSRGVSKIESIELLKENVENALSFSRAKRFIVEEFIENFGYQVAADGFSVDGELIFWCFGNGHFSPKYINPVNPFVPVGSSWPSNMPERIQIKIHGVIQRLITLLNMKTSAYNFDIQVDQQENIYIVDIGARNGGNKIPEIIKYATGVDLIEYSIKSSLGEDCNDLTMIKPIGYWCSYLINSQNDGILKDIVIDEELKKTNLVEYELLINKGEKVSAYTGSNHKLGTMILKFSSMSEMLEKIANMNNLLEVKVEDL